MKASELRPQAVHKEPFRRNRQRFVPEKSGCYVLAAFDGTVLYIGLSVNLRRRMGEHLDNVDKTALTAHGRASLFWWVECMETEKVERTWLNTHVQYEGAVPILNKISSPVAV